jgi:predicted nuclease with TOPRIM domain
LNEQTRVNEEIDRVRQELAVLHDGHQKHSEMVASLKNEAAQTQQSLDEANRHLIGVKETTGTQLAQHQETLAELARIKNEKAVLEETLAPLQAEVDERIKAREVLIAEAVLLHKLVTNLATDKEQRAAEVSELATSHAELQDKVEGLRTAHGSLISEIDNLRQHAADGEQLKGGLSDLHNEIAATVAEREQLREIMAEEQAQVADLLARKGSLEQVVAEAVERQRALLAEIAAFEARSQELAEAAEKAEQARIAEGLPLLFGPEPHRIAAEWDSYSLESEFHTDEVLDAKMVAKLVSMLPGLEGCLIVKNHGPVLASQMPERIHAHLKVPDRNYHLLFDRLEKKVEEYTLDQARLATFDLGTEALTIAQSNHAFVFVNHRQTRLRPGMAGKLASIVSEISKMYP